MKNKINEYVLPVVKANIYTLRLIKTMKILKCILIIFSIVFSLIQTACFIKNK